MVKNPRKNPRIWTTVPPKYVQIIDELVKTGAYVSRGDAMRTAFRMLFRHHEIKLMDWERDI